MPHYCHWSNRIQAVAEKLRFLLPCVFGERLFWVALVLREIEVSLVMCFWESFFFLGFEFC